jgi:hypothetical protein
VGSGNITRLRVASILAIAAMAVWGGSVESEADPGCQTNSFGSCSQDPRAGLPTIPPALPTYIVNGDGSRMNCTPTMSYCWRP